MTISLAEKIQALRPELTSLDFVTVIRVEDDGSGPYIREWNHPTIAQPTEAELASVDEAAYFNKQALKVLRAERDRRLTETDWWVLPDRTATTEQLAYRQALRDLPANTVDPANPVWPTKP